MGSTPACSCVADPRFRRSHQQAAAIALVLLSVGRGSTAAGAENWWINPGFTASETYSDNVEPGTGGSDEYEFITQINPTLQAELRGARIQGTLDYRMQNVLYARDADSSTFQQYLARSGVELVPGHLFVDATSSLTQRTISSDGLRFRNNYIRTDNRTDQLTASIRPSWYQPIGPSAEVLLDYEHGFVKYDDDVVGTSDSTLDSASLAISSRTGSRRLSWKLNVQGQYIDYDDDAFDDVKLRNAGLLLGYRIVPTFSPLVLLGYEDNDFGDRLVSTDPTDPVWALGFNWQPNPRTELEALAGDRFFGRTYRFRWRQRGRYLSSELSYSEEINGEASSALERASLIDDPYEYSNSSVNLTDDLYLSKTVRASLRFEKSRTFIAITPYREKRKFDNAAGDDTVNGVTGTWALRFAPRTTLTLTLHSDKTEEGRGNDDETFTWSDLRVERRLGRKTTGSIEYAYTRSDSDDEQNVYTEHAVAIRLIHHFGKPEWNAPELPPSPLPKAIAGVAVLR